MTFARFEDIPAWQEAVRLAEWVYDMTESKNWPGRRSLQDQLERAALSVSNNIAEGFERGTTNELLAFIYISRGSAGEVRSMLCFLERRKAFGDFKSQISKLKSTAESCCRQLRGWADYLQNSEIKGQRHLNDKARRQYDAGKRAGDFQQELLEKLPPDHPLRKRSL